MKSFVFRHWILAVLAATVLLAVAAVALAPWWIDLGPVRARIERTASSALAGTLTYERMKLSWLPRPEVVVSGLKVAASGVVSGTARTVRVSPAVLPLLRGKVVLTKIGVDGLDLGVTLNAPKDAEQSPAQPGSDWTRPLRSLGSRTLDLELSRSRVVLSRSAGKSLAFEGIRLEAALRAAEGRVDVALSRLSSESPKLVLAGSLRADAGVPSVEASANGSALDVTDVRGKVLSFAGDVPVIAAIFAAFRGGTLTSFSFASSGKAPADLGRLERMTIHAAVEGAKVRVPGPDLDLTDVFADVALEGGVLSAERAGARLGRSRAHDGHVQIGLLPGDDRLRVEALVKADLAEVPAILARVIPGPSLRRELELVEGVEGTAEGRITIGDTRSAPTTRVDVSAMHFSAAYARLPWPIGVGGGRFSFDGKSVGVSGLTGSLGRSTFEGLAARVRLGKRPVLESASGSLDVSLEDFLEGVRNKPEAEPLAKSIERVAGSLHVDLRRVAGPLARLGEASLSASGTFEELLLSFSSRSLPPLSIVSGRFAVDDENVRVEDLEARALDASLRVTGSWKGYREAGRAIEATAAGKLGAEAIRWGWTRASLPAQFRPAAPVTLDAVHVSLAGGGAFSLAGGFVVAGGPRLTLDLAGEGQRIEVRDLTVADGDTRASFALRRPDGAFDVGFRGTLDLATFGRLFEGRPVRRGRVGGDFRALVRAGNPAGLTAEGTLTATDLDVPTPAGPVTIGRLDVRAAENRFDVASSAVVLAEQPFSAAGSLTLRDGAVVLDGDVSTGDLAWARVAHVLGRLEEAKKEQAATAQPPSGTPADGTLSKASSSSSSSLVIRGDLRVSMASFSRESLVFKPVLADVRFGKDGVEATVRRAELCGISTTGEARVLPGGAVAVDARADASGADVNVPLACLGIENARMTGSYALSAQVTGEGAVSALPRLLRGPLTFKAEKGRIGKATVLTRILGVLNATDVFAGKSGTRVGEAIPYDSITADGDVAEGGISIRALALKAPSITMVTTGRVGLLDPSLDLVVLAHPLSTLDKAVQAVPVVRQVLGRDFLAVAVKVTGTIDDPKVGVTPGRDVGKGLIGILERTVTLPVKVLDPSPPNRP